MPPDTWQPSAGMAALQRRAALLAAIRKFFAVRKVMEVNTPVAVKAAVSDPHLDSFALAHSAGFLRTSPEYAMKRLLAAGSGDIYELGPVFRQGEAGRWHNPEFTMLEWYRVGWGYQQLADEVVELLTACSPDLLAAWPVQKLTYAQLSEQVLGINIAEANTSHLIELARTHGWHAHPDEASDSMLLDFLFSHLLQPALPEQTISIITEFPACQAALAQIAETDTGTAIAERFEVFLGQLELANGYQELTDADEQMQRFIEDRRIREQTGKAVIEPDRKLLDALRHGMPACAGVALGVDRLLMVFTRSSSVETTLPFIWSSR